MEPNDKKKVREAKKREREAKSEESGKRLKEALSDFGITQDELAKGLFRSKSTISDRIKGKTATSESDAKEFADFINESARSKAAELGEELQADSMIRWQWLCAQDNCKTFRDVMLANTMDTPEVTLADQLTWACDILLHEAMRKLNLAGGGWQLEDMESGSTVPFTSAQQDEMQRRLQEYAGGLVAHHFIQARINQTELSCAESRGDTVSVAELKKKLQEDI